MRIGEIVSSEEYRMDGEFKNLPILGVKFLFSKLKKNIKNFPSFTISKIIKFPLSTNS